MTEHPTPRTDAELVAAHLGGDPSALAAIYDRYTDALYDTARGMLSDAHDAEDLTHDVFVVAAERLEQLRKPERLRSWLFAILRHEVYRRSERRSRVRATDFRVPGSVEMSAPIDPLAEASGAMRDEAAVFVRDAASGLAERDQLVLELSVRQGLAGEQLADALGVTVQQSHVLLHRMRDRVQRSIGALTVARYGRTDCASLRDLLRNWDGTFEPRLRKRVAGHIDDCETCAATSRKFAVLPLFAAAPAFAAPASLRDRVLASTSGGGGGSSTVAVAGFRFDEVRGFPRLIGHGRRALLLALIATVALLLLGGTWFAVAQGNDAAGAPTAGTTDSPPPTVASIAAPPPSAPPSVISTSTMNTSASSATTPTTSTTTTTTSTSSTTTSTTTTTTTLLVASPPPATTTATPTAPTTTTTTTPTTTTPTRTVPQPGQLVLSAGTIDLGAVQTRATLSLANTGDLPLDWAVTGAAAPFLWSSTAGTLAAGASIDVQVSVDRVTLAEASISQNLTVTSTAAGTTPLTVLASVEHPPNVSILLSPSAFFCPGPAGAMVIVGVVDESAISGVELVWSGPGGSGSVSMSNVAGNWEGLLLPAGVNGTWTWEARATDVRGNIGTNGAPFVVSGC